MKLTKTQLKRIIKEELTKVLKEQAEPDWATLGRNYLKCRLARGPGRHLATVKKHIAQAKAKEGGYNKLVAYIKRKYPECQVG